MALGVMASGCGSADPKETVWEPRVVSATEVCGGGLFPAGAGEVLGRVLQSSEYVIRDEDKDVSVAAGAKLLEDAYRSGADVRNKPSVNCDVSGKAKSFGDSNYFPSAQVRFAASSKNARIPGTVPEDSDAGVLVFGQKWQRSVAFDCVSARVGSTEQIPLRITVTFRNKFDKGGGEEAVLGGDYVFLAHAAALSMAKELNCADHGGLPDSPHGLPAELS
nr:hypothetical protein OG409_23625 [Streptomyces sp. NBC_00974]